MIHYMFFIPENTYVFFVLFLVLAIWDVCSTSLISLNYNLNTLTSPLASLPYLSVGVSNKNHLSFLIEEMLHHLTCMKPCKRWDIYIYIFTISTHDFFHQQYLTLLVPQGRKEFSHLLPSLGGSQWWRWGDQLGRFPRISCRCSAAFLRV